MLTRGTPYKDRSSEFGELVAKRNAPRWKKKLQEYGLI
jgi:hypothetical protein